jgi:hypothetical protein
MSNFEEQIEAGIAKLYYMLDQAKKDRTLCEGERTLETYQDGKIWAFKESIFLLTAIMNEIHASPSLDAQLKECKTVLAGGEQE